MRRRFLMGSVHEGISCAIYILSGGNDQRKFSLKRWISFSVNVALLHHHVPICLGYGTPCFVPIDTKKYITSATSSSVKLYALCFVDKCFLPECCTSVISISISRFLFATNSAFQFNNVEKHSEDYCLVFHEYRMSLWILNSFFWKKWSFFSNRWSTTSWSIMLTSLVMLITKEVATNKTLDEE